MATKAQLHWINNAATCLLESFDKVEGTTLYHEVSEGSKYYGNRWAVRLYRRNEAKYQAMRENSKLPWEQQDKTIQRYHDQELLTLVAITGPQLLELLQAATSFQRSVTWDREVRNRGWN